MLRLVRWFVNLALLAGAIYFAVAVPLGNRTLWGHMRNIWAAEETQELVDGVVEESEPLVDRVKSGIGGGTAGQQDEVRSEPEAVPEANGAAGEVPSGAAADDSSG